MSYTIDKAQQREVIAHLGWSYQQYCEFIEQCGITYLQKYLPGGYPEVIKEITKSPVYWNWWKMHWEKRDTQFLESIDYDPSPILDPVEIYKELHEPRTLAAAVFLSGQVLEESYAEMFGQLTKSKTNKAVATC